MFANSGLKCESKQIKNSRIAEKKKQILFVLGLARQPVVLMSVVGGGFIDASTVQLFAKIQFYLCV